MVREPHENLDNPADRQYIEEQLEQIKTATESGRHEEAQRIATHLFHWLGWN